VRTKILAVLLALSLAVGISLTTASTAQAHSPCTGYCNTIHQYGPVGIGIIDRWGQGWKWILPSGGWATNGTPLYQADVDGFYVGAGYCFQVWQSNDGANYGYWGSARGPFNFLTNYWKYNQANVSAC
jgi:hypothetical protein